MDFWDATARVVHQRDWQFHPKVWPRRVRFWDQSSQGRMKGRYIWADIHDVDLKNDRWRVPSSRGTVALRPGWFDNVAPDLYTAPERSRAATYDGVTNFLSIQDSLIAQRPGYV